MPLLRSRVLSATASLAAAVLLGTTVAATPASAASQNATSRDATSQSAGTGTPEAAAVDRFIVKFADGAGRRAAERADAYEEPAEGLSTEVQEVRSTATGARVVTTDRELDAAEAADLVAELEADPAIEYAEPDLILRPAAASPNDTYYGYQWNFTDPDAGSYAFAGMNVPAAWDVSRGRGMVVAVVDTGITTHGDLNANVLPGYDMISQSGVSGDTVNPRDGDGRDADPSDEGDWYAQDECGTDTGSSASSWHGTHVAGTIAAVTGNGLGVAGVAPEAAIVPVRALGSCGGYASDISDAIIWAAGGTVRDERNNPLPANGHRAHVINLSLGGYGECSATLQGAVDAAVTAGSVVVAAAGNESMDVRYSTPANCGHVVAVAASGPDGSLAGYSNFGESIDVTAPGGTFDAGAAGGILSTTNFGDTVPQDGGDGYSYAEGTSSAAPHVSGVVALLLAAHPSMTPAEVEARLEETARPLSRACAEGCGAGLVNAAAALGSASGGEPDPAVVAGTPAIDDATPAVGQMLTAQAGNGWSPSGLTFAYQWKRDGTPIPDATGSTYTPTPEDLATALSVTVTGHPAGTPGAFASATSAATAAVAEGTLAGSIPTVGGTRKVGSTLRASSGTWTTGTTLAYQWYRSGTAISGATKSAYGLAGADAGHRITVKVTGTRTGYTRLSRTSAATTAIAKGTLRAGTPTISGTAKVGSRLTAKAGTWTTGTRLTYQWYRSGTKIKGATKSVYRLVAADRKDTIKVRVTGAKAGYTTAYRYSKATARTR
ncbi:hypothetical protein NCCP1664_12840 [Zafaria cholistanensis]|uniref:Peptidase S8/S53 domain-containing protein n=1 Tax=Zafaria cholistanensis TaxID=1682741 RepID=A0A5A7NS51_9MICC|nr:S8 family serine peptidase [Zafaria cholistanensis]GER22787.1 hypothetical protein NCCP1664_12840 [Zafaria cholistanensis]